MHTVKIILGMLAAWSLYIVTLPLSLKCVGYIALCVYLYRLLREHPVKNITPIGNAHVQCEMSNGAVCFATIADDSIFLRWFILLRLVPKNHQATFSVIVFKWSPHWTTAQQLRKQW